jgi:hypothetical protein
MPSNALCIAMSFTDMLFFYNASAGYRLSTAELTAEFVAPHNFDHVGLHTVKMGAQQGPANN